VARFTGLLGLITFLGVAYALSTNRRALSGAPSPGGLACRSSSPSWSSSGPNGQHLLQIAATGDLDAGPRSRRLHHGLRPLGDPHSVLHVFAFAVLPTIIFCQRVLRRALPHRSDAARHQGGRVDHAAHHGHQRAESSNVAPASFMGQTEAPLTIRPFLRRHQLRVDDHHDRGMAHVSGGIMAAYYRLALSQGPALRRHDDRAGNHPGGRCWFPETEVPGPAGTVHCRPPRSTRTRTSSADRARHHRRRRAGLHVAIMLISFLRWSPAERLHERHIELLWRHGHVPFRTR